MAINPDFAGRTFPPGEPYEVSREKLREFANAIGDPNPVYPQQGRRSRGRASPT